MKNNKLAVLLFAAVMAFGIAGCGGDTEGTAAALEAGFYEGTKTAWIICQQALPGPYKGRQ